MKIKGCTYCYCIDDDGLWTLCFNVEDVDEEYVETAKQEDGEYFLDSCFELQVYYQEKREYCDIHLTPTLIYVLSEGDDLELDYELSGEQEMELMTRVLEEINA